MTCDTFEIFCGSSTNDAINFINEYNNFINEYNNFQIENNNIQIENNNIIEKDENNIIEKEKQHKTMVLEKFKEIENDDRWGLEYINSNQINGARLTGYKFPKRLDGKWIFDNGIENEYISKQHIENKTLFKSEKNNKNIKIYIGIIKTLMLNYEKFTKLTKLCGNPFVKETTDGNGMKLKYINQYINNKSILFSKNQSDHRITNPIKRFWAIINNVY